MFMAKQKKEKCIHCKRREQEHGRICHRCVKKRYTTRNPLNYAKYIFNALKQNAKRRQKDFQLSFDQFQTFCENTSYLVLKGREPEKYCIDRKNHHIGYTFDNIQLKTGLFNSRKSYWERSQMEQHMPDEFKNMEPETIENTEFVTEPINHNNPF
jgi:hypothetical protein